MDKLLENIQARDLTVENLPICLREKINAILTLTQEKDESKAKSKPAAAAKAAEQATK